MGPKNQYGDFQTPDRLAETVVTLVNELFGAPDLVVEPTVGSGAFLVAAAARWGQAADYVGYDINRLHVSQARRRLKQARGRILERDFFLQDWHRNLSPSGKKRPLVVGNPPWVTNSDLGLLGSTNLPDKSNFRRLDGSEARTGKSNFDIAEWMLLKLIEALPPNGAIAMLCKTMTARRVLHHCWQTDGGRAGARLFRIDAKAEFNVAVDACLFYATGSSSEDRSVEVYDGLDPTSKSTTIGFVAGKIVADRDTYFSHQYLEGGSEEYRWRSGLKHDAAKVMEFTRDQTQLINGYGETVELEEDYLWPLLKSSDVGNGRARARKAVLVTQRHTSDDTEQIRHNAPKTWEYLVRHSSVLDNRKSSIYKNRARFGIFGIGPYSFAPWKVAISGLYKEITFLLVPPCNERAVMLDDTCYSIACHSGAEAEFLLELLSSEEAKAFLKSLVFVDSKRPITLDVLRRLSIEKLARRKGRLKDFRQFSVLRSARSTG